MSGMGSSTRAACWVAAVLVVVSFVLVYEPMLSSSRRFDAIAAAASGASQNQSIEIADGQLLRSDGGGGQGAAPAGAAMRDDDGREELEDAAPVVLPTYAPNDKRIIRMHPAARNQSIVFGILTAPELIQSRLQPLLRTSLAGEDAIAYFLRNASNRAALADLEAFIARHQLRAAVVELDPLDEMKMSIRNAWADLPVLAHMISARPQAQWYAIIDDDTYVLAKSTRHILAEYATNQTAMAEPIYLGDTLSWGKGGGWRLVKNQRTKKKTLVPSTRRKPVDFVVGGSGIFINSAAARAIQPHLAACMAQYFHPAGDIRLGACMGDHGVPMTRRKEFIKDIVFRAVGELQLFKRADRPFPASFHRFRAAAWYRAMARVEAAKPGDELVTWHDLRAFFTVRPPYYEFLFYPKRFANYTTVFGIRTAAPGERKKKYSRYTIPPRGNPQADEW